MKILVTGATSGMYTLATGCTTRSNEWSSKRDRSVQNVPSPAKISLIDCGWKFSAKV